MFKKLESENLDVDLDFRLFSKNNLTDNVTQLCKQFEIIHN